MKITSTGTTAERRDGRAATAYGVLAQSGPDLPRVSYGYPSE